MKKIQKLLEAIINRTNASLQQLSQEEYEDLILELSQSFKVEVKQDKEIEKEIIKHYLQYVDNNQDIEKINIKKAQDETDKNYIMKNICRYSIKLESTVYYTAKSFDEYTFIEYIEYI